MAKKKDKVAAGVDATKKLGVMHLVVARAGCDDLPMLLTPSALVARIYAGRSNLGRDLLVAADVMGVDTSVWCNISIVTLKAGRPIGVRIVRDINEGEIEVANGGG